MTDLLEKKLGDLLSELEARRDQLRSELERVNAQLDLLANLVSTSSGKTKQSAKETDIPKPLTTRVRELKLAVARKPAKPETGVSDKARKTKQKKQRGRPKGSRTTVAAKPAATSASNKNEKTLKEELFAIAKANNGKFRVRDASKQLVKAGRYEDTTRAAANIHAAIAYYSTAFVKDKSERGLYRVKGG